jgi:hypothetical protein
MVCMQYILCRNLEMYLPKRLALYLQPPFISKSASPLLEYFS